MQKSALAKLFKEVEERTGFSESQIRHNTALMRSGPIIDARNEIWWRLQFEFGWSRYSIQLEFNRDNRVVRNGIANWAKMKAAAA